jgi:hypothetical protein
LFLVLVWSSLADDLAPVPLLQILAIARRQSGTGRPQLIKASRHWSTHLVAHSFKFRLAHVILIFAVVATNRGRGRRPRHGSGIRLTWFLTVSHTMADTSAGGSEETPSPRPPPPCPRSALRPQSNRAPTASSAVASAPSSSAATTPNSTQPQPAAAGIARTVETTET